MTESRRSRFAHMLPKTVTTLAHGYGRKLLAADLFAGLTVGIVALPLSMAFAIAAGMEPERGIYTAIVAGFIVALLGGSRFQIAGPTGAFVVIIVNIHQQHGFDGLVLATILAGIMLVILGAARIGSFIKFIPYPVTAGFTAGIGLNIFVSQLRDFFGLSLDKVPAEFIERVREYASVIDTADVATFIVGTGSLAIIIGFRKYLPRVPGPVVAVVAGAVIVWLFDIPTATIETRFGGVERGLPPFTLPVFTLADVRAVFPGAVTIALLAGIESLLSAVVADGMSGDRHRSNVELVAQGIANIASPLFGGIPATGAIARTATNIKNGAKTPIAGMFHAVVLVVFIVYAAPLASYIPLATLAAVLFMVAWNMMEFHRLLRLLKAPRSDVFVLGVTFLLTVLVDLTVAVQVGVVMAALLFMKRMADTTSLDQVSSNGYDEYGYLAENDPDSLVHRDVPDGVDVYEIHGPFFFGVADRLKNELANLARKPAVFILRMRHVPDIDASGEDALEDLISRNRKTGTTLVLSGVRQEPRAALARMGLLEKIGEDNVTPHIDAALERARIILMEKKKD